MVATIVYHVSLEYLLLFNADKSHIIVAMETLGGGRGEGQNGPTHALYIKLWYDFRLKDSNAKYFTILIIFLKLHTCVKA